MDTHLETRFIVLAECAEGLRNFVTPRKAEAMERAARDACDALCGAAYVDQTVLEARGTGKADWRLVRRWEVTPDETVMVVGRRERTMRRD